MANKNRKDEYEPQKGLIAWFAHNHVAANILMMLFLVGGMISIFSMRSETFPQIDPRLVTISVVYPGATPYEIEDSITSRVEESLIGIEGVKRISSKASEGYGLINVEMEDFANVDDVYNDVETNVNGLSDFPPENAERPIITKTKITPSVMLLALHGEVDEGTLRYWAENIEDELRQVDGVAQTSLRGVRDYQISVEVTETNLRQYGLTLEDIQRAIQSFSQDIPAGTVEAKQGDILLRVQEKRYTGEEFENIILRSLPDGSTLRIKDIGSVVDGFTDTNLISKFNGERSAFIEVFRSETADTIAVSASIKTYIEDVVLPKGLTLTIQQDQTTILQERMSLMMRNAILGFMLVFLILLLFLDLKLAFWTSVAIPVSFLGGIMIINFMGYSINMISLFALIVVLGIVVDDAIVTGESIFEAQNNDPEDPNATLKGVKRVIAPVTVGVTTTMTAFAPLIFSTGTLGQIIGIIPIVVIPILFISLLEAYFILPAHLSTSTRWSKGIVSTIRDTCAAKLRWFIETKLGPAAKFLMMWRYPVLAVFVGFAIITASMVQYGTIRFIFFPNIEGDEITINVEMPVGTPFQTTQDTLLRIEDEAQAVREEIKNADHDIFENLTLSIGEQFSMGGPGSGPGSSNANNLGQLKIKLVSSDFRNISASDVEGMIRKRIENFPGIEELSFQSSLVGDEPEIEVELSHPEIETLKTAANELKEQLAAINGTREVTDTFDVGKTEYVFELTDQGLAAGLTPQALGQQLRSAFFGLEAQRFQRGRSEVIVYIRYPEKERDDISSLNNKRIRLADGSEVPLSVVANINVQQGYSRIETVNGRRIVSVTSDVDAAIITDGEVTDILSEELLPALKQKYAGLSAQFEGQTRERQEDMQSLANNMLIAMMLIYVLLGAQLRSYVQPLIIMSAIPFGVIGAVWGHFLLGYDLTFISLFGIVALTGVVVNDSVVLMDFLNHQRDDNKMSTFDSALSAIQRRFRPILLTTLTTSLGLLPMLLETSLQAQFLIPMVVSLATGILFATVIILLLIPILVLVVDDIGNTCQRGVDKLKKKAPQI